MAEIPFDEDYLRKHYPDKYKELEKNKTQSSISQSKNEDIKHHNKVEKDYQELIDGVLKHPAFGLFDDKIKKVLIGDIEWPKIPELEEFKVKEPNNHDELVKSQTAWLVEASAYILMHLKRWVEEKVEKEVEDFYRTFRNPFTYRMSAINITCEYLLDVLPARLPTLEHRFREQYEKMVSVAKEADEKKLLYIPGKDINNFKLAARDFYEIVMMIHSEALVTLKANLAKKPTETGRKTKVTIVAIIISLLIICAFELSVWLMPFTPFTWLKNHPQSYGIQGSAICLIPCLIFGFFKPRWRKWWWGTAIAFLVGLLTLL